MEQFKSLYRNNSYSHDFICFYKVYVYDQEHIFDTELEARNFSDECEREGMEVDLYEVEREDLVYDNGESYDSFSIDEVETLKL